MQAFDPLANTEYIKNYKRRLKEFSPIKYIQSSITKEVINAILVLRCRHKFILSNLIEYLEKKMNKIDIIDVLHQLELSNLIQIESDFAVICNLTQLRYLSENIELYSSECFVDSAKKSKNNETSANIDESSVWKNEIDDLLNTKTHRQAQEENMDIEILELLQYKSFKEKLSDYNFFSHSNSVINEYCVYRTADECYNENHLKSDSPCKKVHFKRLLQKNTDTGLGDCSFLNACFHSSICKYVHYEVDTSYLDHEPIPTPDPNLPKLTIDTPKITLFRPQWVKCDLRYFEITTLGKFDVIMADPPWDIHMELPYGTLGDTEMMKLPILDIQDEGYIFLWVTGRAMELGRECLNRWGYKRCDELVWVKTNQLQRLIRTGRTGHWLNHGKEHCLVGIKGNPKGCNPFIDCDVIVSEVRDTSHKPDEIYGVIERFWPNSRKIELFGRQHNTQPNWVTLGNQMQGVGINDPDIIMRFRKKYPNGYNIDNLENPRKDS